MMKLLMTSRSKILLNCVNHLTSMKSTDFTGIYEYSLH